MAAETAGGVDQRAAPARTAELGIGSLISITSISENRYEGYIIEINVHSIGLRNVKFFGTEGRLKYGPQISAHDCIYEYIYLRGSNIKDLQVISSPSPQSTSVVPDDTAIIRPRFPHPTPTTMASTSHSAAEVANVSSTSVQPIQPHDPSASSSSFWGSLLPPPPANISRLAVPNYLPGLVGSSGRMCHFQQQFSVPPLSLVASQDTVQQQALHQNVNTSVVGGSSFSEHQHPLWLRRSTSLNTSNALPPLLSTPSVQSNPGEFDKLASNLSSIPMPNIGSGALSSVPANPDPNMASSFPEVFDENATLAPVTDERNSVEPTGVSFSRQSKLCPMTIEEQSGPRQSSPSQSLQTTNINAKTAPAPVVEPLPDSTEETSESLLKHTIKTGSTSSHHDKGTRSAQGRDQNPHIITRFKDDFDFEAMNKKFNKKEVWDFFRKNNKAKADDGDLKGKAREVHEKDNSKPVYRKDDFFDFLSYGAPEHESKVTLTEQRRRDDETFGVKIPLLHQDHGKGSHSARTSQASFGGRGHGNMRGSHRGPGRTVWRRLSK